MIYHMQTQRCISAVFTLVSCDKVVDMIVLAVIFSSFSTEDCFLQYV